MIEQLKVVNYKGLRSFSLDTIGRVNLVTGPNGVGKSSLTEALWLFHGRYNPVILWNLHVQRRESLQGFSPLIALGNGDPIELRGSEDGASYGVRFDYDEIVQPLQRRPNGSSRPVDAGEELGFSLGNVASGGVEGPSFFPTLGSLRADYGQNDPHIKKYYSEVILGPTGPGLARPIRRIERPTGIIVNRDAPFPIDSDRVERFSNVVARGEKRQLLDLLRLIRPHIRDIEILSHQGTPSLWADMGDQDLLPLEALGGGVVRLLSLFVNFFNARGGLIVIDEIENGIHHSALQEIWQQIKELCVLLDVQSVITTHSRECIEAAVAAQDSGHGPSDFVVHQMYQTEDGERRSETYAGEKLKAALELGFDTR